MSSKSKAKSPAKTKPESTAKPKAKPTPKSKAKPKTTAKPKTPSKTKPTPKAKEPKTTPKSKPVKTSDYLTLLHRAREQIPPEVFEQPRFQIPKMDSFIQGTRTVVKNFKDITDILRRDTRHLLRFLSHELATAGELSGRQAIFNGRFTVRALNELVEKYTREYVLCPICNRPDTEMKREDRLLVLVCSACGGRTPLKSI